MQKKFNILILTLVIILGTNTFISAQANHLDWSTYLGGNSTEGVINNVAVTDDSNVFVVTYTTSTDLKPTVGAYQTFNNGGADAFIVKYNKSGKILWSTYFGTSNGSERVRQITIDQYGSLYIVGNTNGTGLAYNTSSQSTNNGGNDGFLAKFSA